MPTAGLRPQWRELQALQEDTTTASMDTDRGITEADMRLRKAEGLLPSYDQTQPSEATTDQPAAPPADVQALAGVRAWAEYEANIDADDAVICPPTRTLLALLEVRESDLHRPLANLELPTVEQLVEAVAATISQRINTPPELQHAQWLADTMTAAGVEMHAIRLRTIVIYLTESEFDPSELLIHPFSQTIREAGELGGNTGHNQIRCATIGLRKKARKTAQASLALRATGRPIYTLNMQLTVHHHITIIGGTRSTDRTDQWRKTGSSTYHRGAERSQTQWQPSTSAERQQSAPPEQPL
eukprot:jgi/Tetstr1/440949/TSEL_029218.t1